MVLSAVSFPAQAEDAVKQGNGQASSIGVPNGSPPLVGVPAYTSPSQPVFVAPGQPVYIMPSQPATGGQPNQAGVAPVGTTGGVPSGSAGATVGQSGVGSGAPNAVQSYPPNSIAPGMYPPGVPTGAYPAQPQTIGGTIKDLVRQVTNSVQIQRGTDGVHVKAPFVNVNVDGGDPDVKIRAPLVKVDHVGGQTNVKAPFTTIGEPVRTP